MEGKEIFDFTGDYLLKGSVQRKIRGDEKLAVLSYKSETLAIEVSLQYLLILPSAFQQHISAKNSRIIRAPNKKFKSVKTNL
jgi:hypothetical protein